jgi:hypothetical protein
MDGDSMNRIAYRKGIMSKRRKRNKERAKQPSVQQGDNGLTQSDDEEFDPRAYVVSNPEDAPKPVESNEAEEGNEEFDPRAYVVQNEDDAG